MGDRVSVQIQPVTVKAMPKLLDALKESGFKIVHLKSKEPAKSLPEYQATVEKEFKGRTMQINYHIGRRFI